MLLPDMRGMSLRSGLFDGLVMTGLVASAATAALFALGYSFGFLLSASAILLQEIELRRTA